MNRKICKIKNCENINFALDLCQKHYTRFKRHGDPLYTKTEQHGLTHTSTYSIWCAIKDRCLNPNNDGYSRYGGRGITMCDRWKNSFIAFYEDMGPRPFPNAQIDRKENGKGYNKSNCRWVTCTVNNRTWKE